jgi:hypothetical protein
MGVERQVEVVCHNPIIAWQLPGRMTCGTAA